MKKIIEWVPVSERTPDAYTRVLVSGGAAFFNDTHWFSIMHGEHRKISWEVTHWAPIPVLLVDTNPDVGLAVSDILAAVDMHETGLYPGGDLRREVAEIVTDAIIRDRGKRG
jgi:hypothetical protein